MKNGTIVYVAFLERCQMTDLDHIMDMLDWNNAIDVQKKGIELAGKVKNINAFIQPYYGQNSKMFWENCAVILCARPDFELEPYLYDLLRWISDLNWPGARRVYERLERFSLYDSLSSKINRCKEEAIALEEDNWAETLRRLENSYSNKI